MDTYGPEFFGAIRESSRNSAEVVVPLVSDFIGPASVVDIGCGTGEWIDVFARHGVSDYLGVDGAYGGHTTIAQSHFVAADLSLPCSLGRTFDLAMSLEVAEHLPVERASGFVADLVRLAPAVLFSAAIPAQGGIDHVNERWQSWWADHFAIHGYAARDVIRPLIWDDDRVAVWYRQNTILYVRDAEPTNTILDVVHPRTLEKGLAPRGLRQNLAQLPAAARRSIRHRFR
jgi:SAM-dependent methyltransferase